MPSFFSGGVIILVMSRNPRCPLLFLGALFAWAGVALAQSAPEQPAQTPLSFKVLADQVTARFPVVQTEIVEVAERRVTLASGRSDGVLPGVEFSAFREGRELYHPTTKKLLGRTEEPLGRLVVTESLENYSIATAPPGATVRAGDKARVTAGKVPLWVLTLASGPRPRVVEAAAYDLVQELERTGRFQVMIGDQIAVWLDQQKIAPEEFLKGKGTREASARFNAAHILALHFTSVQNKPFVDARLFSGAVDAPLVQTAMFVPPAARKPARDFSAGGAAGTVKVERRSLLAKLLTGDFEPNQYSAAASSIPIREVATFPFIVKSMDVAVAPADKTPRLVVTDGQKVYLYKVNGLALDAEWTHDKWLSGNILSVQLADLDNDGVLEVVVNRQDVKAGMLSYILATQQGRPKMIADDIPLLLLAMDEKGDRIPTSLWGQKPDTLNFFQRGSATRYVLKDGDVVSAGRVPVNDEFRLTGATMSNIAGKDNRTVAFVDDQSRLKLASGPNEMWRSLTRVGGGLTQAHLQYSALRTTIDKFVKLEPNPVSVDLDGDGVQEVVVPVNDEAAGRLAVVYRGPAGFRMQVVASGFEGMITGLGAIPTEGGSPSLVAAVVKRTATFLFQHKGETQIIMTLPE